MSREKTHRSQIREADRKENLQLYLMMLPVFLLILIFCYAPLFGVVIAFQDYVPGAPFFGENTKWVAFKHFTLPGIKHIIAINLIMAVGNVLATKNIKTIYTFTHDQTEAMILGDRIVIMKDGFIQQIGTPQMNVFNDAKLVKVDSKYAVQVGGLTTVLSDEPAGKAG